MDQCPKCLSKDVAGPTYVKDERFNEALEYKCGRCGYKKKKPTADSYDKGASPNSQTAIDQRALAGKQK